MWKSECGRTILFARYAFYAGFGPSDALDTMKAAYTLPLNLDNITDTLKREVALSAPKGAKYIPASVKLTLPVDMYTEKTVEVPLRGINFPAGKVLRTFPSKVKISGCDS